MEGFVPIAAYGFLGDGRAAALVASDGHVDWLAAPRLDAPPLCAAILDPAGGGSIVLEPAVAYASTRRYLPGTAVIETTFRTEGGTVRVTDSLNTDDGRPLPWTELARRVEADGEVPMRWSVRPGTRLSTTRPWASRTAHGPRIVAGDCQLLVVAEGIGEPEEHVGGFSGSFVALAGRRSLLAVLATAGEPTFAPSAEAVDHRIEVTCAGWRRFCDAVRYEGAHGVALQRSAIVLKQLSVGPSAAIAAGATTSLPERIGGERNFDYRFAWVRDGSFSIDALTRVGASQDVHRSLSWLLGAVEHTAPDVHVLYTLDGQPAAARVDRPPNLPGYRQSLPVEVGNGAASQRQLGTYGDLVGAIWRYVDHGGQLDERSGRLVASLADAVCDQWMLPDAGIWELSDYRHYTSSKISCWSALVHAADLARRGQTDRTHVARWQAEAGEIRDYVSTRCWSSSRQAFAQYADGEALDAAVLLAARTGFLDGDDPRLSSTIDAILAELARGPLLYRYSGMAEKEGAFLVCSFWAVEALAHAGRLEQAGELLDGALAQANDLGLLSEEADPGSGELLGNLPLALSHLGVVGAVTALERARSARSRTAAA